jgi:hypothetical protein
MTFDEWFKDQHSTPPKLKIFGKKVAKKELYTIMNKGQEAKELLKALEVYELGKISAYWAWQAKEKLK